MREDNILNLSAKNNRFLLTISELLVTSKLGIPFSK